ncbi:GIY-YIG nuclease family protein [Micromonospora sp. NBC_00421]|uniref:GIY-YIG nuclease family protein n=1 Tax=Micromonospora sp. NBC_00421 TaxID=2975976 RepID=UPI002E23C0FB
MEEPNPSYMVIAGVQYVTTDEAAKRLGDDVTPDMIRDWTKRGLLKPVGRYGGRANIYRLADVAHAEMRTRTARHGRARKAGELQKAAEWGHNLPADEQADSAQKPVKVPRCSVVHESSRECNRFAVPGIPFRICREHAHEAYLHWKDHHPEAPRVEVVIQGPECISRGECISKIEKRQLVPRIETRQPYVYYIRFGDRIKIGYSRNLSGRLANLPHDEVMAIEPGPIELEQMRHRQFAVHRITSRGEWFHMHPDLLAHIEMLVQHFGTADAQIVAMNMGPSGQVPTKHPA